MSTVRLRASALVTALVALCLPAALLAPPASATPPRTNPLAPFTAPVTVGAAVPQQWPQEVVPDGLGVLDVWVGGTASAQRVFARRWLPSGGWGPAVALSGTMQGVVMHAASSGDAAVVGWTGTLASGVTLAQASVRATRLGRWSAPRTLGTAMGAVSVGATGTSVGVAWMSPGPSSFAVEAATWALDGPSMTTGTWAPTVFLRTGLTGLTARTRFGLSGPSVVLTPGAAVVVWREHDAVTGDLAMASTWNAIAGWSAPTRVSADAESCRIEAVEPTPQGATVLTSCVRGGSIVLDARDWSSLGTPSWAAATTLDDQAMPEASRGLWDLDAAWGGSGSSIVAVAWRHVGAPSTPGTVTVAIHVARRSPAGIWSSSVQMSRTGATAAGPAVGVNGAAVVVAWYRMIGSTYGVETRTLRPDGSVTGSYWATEGVPARYVDALVVSGTPTGAVIAWLRRPARNTVGIIEAMTYGDTTGSAPRHTLGTGYALSAAASRTSMTVTWQHAGVVVGVTGSLLAPAPKGLPVITRKGRTLFCTPPAYSPVPWQIGAAWFDRGVYIPNSTRAVYVVPASRLGHTFRCRIAAATMGFPTNLTWSAPVRVAG